MLAHAMAHVVERHGLRQVAPGQVRERRKFESEADQRAVGMLAAADYDPGVLKAYISREQVDAENGLFSRWPVRELRVAAIDAAIRER